MLPPRFGTSAGITARCLSLCFFFNDTATTEIYTLSLHDALPIWNALVRSEVAVPRPPARTVWRCRSEEHTSELQSPYVISYAVFCLKKKHEDCVNTYEGRAGRGDAKGNGQVGARAGRRQI